MARELEETGTAFLVHAGVLGGIEDLIDTVANHILKQTSIEESWQPKINLGIKIASRYAIAHLASRYLNCNLPQTFCTYELSLTSRMSPLGTSGQLGPLL